MSQIVNSNKEYVDTKDLDVKGMAEDLKAFKGRTSTSCPSPNDWIASFEDADVVYAFTITSKLSGSYNSAVVAKQMYEQDYPERKVYVVDSLTAGPCIKLLIDHLNLRIIGIANEGVIDPIHKVRGDKKAIKQIMATMLEKGYKGGKVYFSHCFNEKNLELLKATILEKFPDAHIETMPCGGLVSFYAELGGVVVGYEG